MNIMTRRWGVALAAVSATMALSGIGASGASAALPGHCTGSAIAGAGSSLQAPAQNIWTTTFRDTSTNGGCLGGPTVSYATSSSGACLNAIGANSGLPSSVNTGTSFCGTDDAPNTTQINNIKLATGGNALSIPVAQAAIALVVNPPTNCSITGFNSNPSTTVETVFRGASSTTTWASIGGTGTGCSAAINRVVRADTSGTTYQLKHYLSTANSASLPGIATTWTQLQGGEPNTTWPGTVVQSRSGCASAMTLTGCTGAAGSGSGGGDEARTVAATSGSIGYASLADARSITISGGATSPTYKWLTLGGVNPSSNNFSTARGTSRCPTTGTGTYGTVPTATSPWDSVYLTVPGSSYPVCTLTWDLALSSYANFPSGSAKAQSVQDYLHYILLGGQTDALSSNNDYAILPPDVKTAATAGLSDITG